MFKNNIILEDQIVDALKNLPFVKRIILFGSRARGDHGQKSDFDISIDCPQATPDDWLKIIQITEKIPTLLKIQVINFNTTSRELRSRILEEGKILYEEHQN